MGKGGGRKGSMAGKTVEEIVKDEGEWSIWEIDGEKDVVSSLLCTLPCSTQLANTYT